MSLRSNEIVQLHKKAYAPCDAPESWFDEVTRTLTNAGWIAMTLGPCLWMLYEKGTIVCVAVGHVDDMVVGVHRSSPRCPAKL